MSNRYQGGFITASYNGLKVPDAPTIGTATAGNLSASVAFTAPTNIGGGAITGYTAISSPGGFTGTGTSSPITVSGLTNGTAYTFTVLATNAYGTGVASSASNSVTPAPTEASYTTAGTYSWVAPAGVTSVCVVCVGAGGNGAGNGAGGGGGGLAYKNNIAVTPGSSYSVVVGSGSATSFQGVTANQGNNGGASGGAGGTASGGDVNYSGGAAGSAKGGGGGGAAGYTGTGGTGGVGGGAGGDTAGGGGGGIGLYGYTSSSVIPGGGGYGYSGTANSGVGGTAGSGGTAGGGNALYGSTAAAGGGGNYGGGGGGVTWSGGGSFGGGGTDGAVRLVWGGKSFPTNAS